MDKVEREPPPAYQQVIHNEAALKLPKFTSAISGNIVLNINREVVEVWKNADIYTDMHYNSEIRSIQRF
jgi:hypothetical protein